MRRTVWTIGELKRRCIERNGCWEWSMQKLSNKPRQNYGRTCVDGRMTLTHRLAWRLAFGDPGGMDVLHRCDNPPCCNPEHLFLGTQADNNADRDSKGRLRTPDVKGSRHPSSMLTDAQVIAIRARYAAGEIQREIAKSYGVRRGTVSSIVCRKSWQHIP